jgi:putative flippase GtrA
LPIAFPAIFLIGFLAGHLLSKVSAVFSQIIKFGEIGVLNTFIDTGILNLLISITGITSGVALAPLNTLSFLCAMTNSYFWNKFWTFKNPSTNSGPAGNKATSKNFFQFLIVSGVGWGINTGILVLGTTFLDPAFNLSEGAWANLVKFASIIISMVWNFVGYKFFVFKKNNG